MTLRLREVRKTFGRAVVALDRVSVEFEAGTFTAVMGPSGSGKSTLLHCAAGLDRADSGEIVLAGTDLAGLSETALTLLRREHVGFVFQAFNLVPSLTASQNVALPLRLAGRKPSPAEVAHALASVGLGERGEHYPSELSGGEQQRVAVARALIARPAVLFADEPTGALDSHTSREVMELLRKLVDAQKQTLVMVTHDPVAAGYADRIVHMADGRITC